MPYSAFARWHSTGYKLGRLELVKDAAVKIQKGWRNYNAYLSLTQAWRGVVHLNSQAALDAIASVEVQKVREKLAANIMMQKMKESLLRLRKVVRIQKHVRGTFPRIDFLALKKQAEIEKNASFVAESVYMMTGQVEFLAKYYRAIVKIQSLARGYVVLCVYIYIYIRILSHVTRSLTQQQIREAENIQKKTSNPSRSTLIRTYGRTTQRVPSKEKGSD